jgi:hypothetical protein
MKKSLNDVERRTADLLAAPAGCAFLRIAEASGLAPEVVAQPLVSLHIAAWALTQVSRWNVYHQQIVAATLEQGSRLNNMARAVLTSPQAAWWFGPLDRRQQIWLSGERSSPDPTQLIIPQQPPDSWERYAQKPARGLYTSTMVDTISSQLTGAGDLLDLFGKLPLACWRLEAPPDVRIVEVDGPQAWHDLCVKYPAIGEDGQLVPDWSAIAKDWDAVHLTLGGLLTAEQVRVESQDGWTTLWGWDCEQTVWLHWRFTDFVRLSDIEEHRDCPVELSYPDEFHIGGDSITFEFHKSE